MYLFGILGVLFLALTAVFGFALLRGLKLPLKEMELVVASPIVGIAIASWLCLVPATLFESLDVGIIVSAFIMLVVIAMFWPRLPSLEYGDLVPAAVITFISFVFMFLGLLLYFNGEYHVAFPFYGDAAFHAAMTTSFSRGFNFPPEYPMMAGQTLRYTFLIDFFSSALDRLGLGLEWCIVLPNWLLLSGLLSSLYFMGVRFTDRRAGGVLSVVLLVLSGGLGFVWAFKDLLASGMNPLEFIARHNLNYTTYYELGLVFTNFMVIVMAQRGALIGFAVGIFIILVMYAMLVRREFDERATRNGLLLSGMLVGLLPLFHVYSYICILFPVAFLMLFFRERKWIYFMFPAMLLAIPQALWISEQMGASYFRVQIGWMAGSIFNIPFFWVQNMGIMLVLLIAGMFLVSRKNLIFYLPFLAIFVMANLFVFQPWDYDNHKFFSFWLMPSVLLMASSLLAVYDRPKLGKPLFAGLLVLTVLTGALVAAFILFHPYVELNKANIYVGDWVVDNTPKDAVFLTSDSPISPITTYAGRKSYVGYGGWLYTHGINISDRETVRKDIYSTANSTEALRLLRDGGIDYIYMGPSEMSSGQYAMNRSFFDRNFECVLSWTDPTYFENYRIYKV